MRFNRFEHCWRWQSREVTNRLHEMDIMFTMVQDALQLPEFSKFLKYDLKIESLSTCSNRAFVDGGRIKFHTTILEIVMQTHCWLTGKIGGSTTSEVEFSLLKLETIARFAFLWYWFCQGWLESVAGFDSGAGAFSHKTKFHFQLGSIIVIDYASINVSA